MIQYVRKGKNRFPIGVLVAKLDDDGRIVVGHSKWCQSRDKYDKMEGIRIADSRADLDSKSPPALSILKAYGKFLERALKYYKGASLSFNTQEAFVRATKKLEAVKEEHAAEKANYAMEV